MVLIAESRVTNLPPRVHAFQVITNAKALMVYADTMEERDRWIAALEKQIAGLKERALQRRSRRNVRWVDAVSKGAPSSSPRVACVYSPLAVKLENGLSCGGIIGLVWSFM